MTFEDLKAHFGNASYRKIAKTLGISPSQLTYYRKHGIPLGRQVLISEQTNGKLKVSTNKEIPNVP